MAENTENKYLNKVPPHDNDAEQAVLACMLFDNEGARIAIEGLDSQDFYSPAHQLIFSAISDLYNGAMPVDIITTKNKLIEMGVLEKVGGPEYIIKSEACNINATYLQQIEAENIDFRRSAQPLLDPPYEAHAFGAVQLREQLDRLIRLAAELFARLLQRKVDIHMAIIVHPAVSHGQAHAVQHEAVQ